MKALIDADIVAYRSAAAAWYEDEGIAKYYADSLLDEILAATKADSFNLYLTGKGNFRYQIYPEYKANRIEQERPPHLPYLRDYLLSIGAILADGCEADDLLGAEQCSSEEETVIVSLDKDLLTIPGNHYSWEIRGKSKGKAWVKEAVWQTKSEWEANHFLYTQFLTGDLQADNVPGLPGCGKVGARRILEGCETEQDMFNAVRAAYDNDDEFLMNARVLYIWRKLDDDYKVHFERLSNEGDHSGQS